MKRSTSRRTAKRLAAGAAAVSAASAMVAVPTQASAAGGPTSALYALPRTEPTLPKDPAPSQTIDVDGWVHYNAPLASKLGLQDPGPAVSAPTALPYTGPRPSSTNTTFADCPPAGPGVTCTVHYLVAAGPYKSRYWYADPTGLHNLGWGAWNCSYPVCNIFQIGYPGAGFSVEWEVNGNSASIYSITSP